MTQIKKETDELFSSRTNNLLAQIQSTVRYHVANKSCSWCDKTVRIDEFKDQLSKDQSTWTIRRFILLKKILRKIIHQ